MGLDGYVRMRIYIYICGDSFMRIYIYLYIHIIN